MKYKFINEKIAYTGAQLRPHWIFKNFGILGDAIVAFLGPAKVKDRKPFDSIDAKEGRIVSEEDMLHFIVEYFDLDIEKSIYKQRILATIIQDELNNRIEGKNFKRIGDDIYQEDKKIISCITNLTPVSTLIYTGINLVSKSKTAFFSLMDYKVDPISFAKAILKKYCDEIKSIKLAKTSLKGKSEAS